MLPIEVLQGSIDVQSSRRRRRRQEFRTVHCNLFHSGTPLWTRFQIYGSFESQKLSEEQQEDRQVGAGMIPPFDMLFSVVSSSRYQLLETARGLKYLHGLDIVHGNIDVVRPPRVTAFICAH